LGGEGFYAWVFSQRPRTSLRSIWGIREDALVFIFRAIYLPLFASSAGEISAIIFIKKLVDVLRNSLSLEGKV